MCFTTAFQTTFLAIFELLLMGGAGYFVIRLGFLKGDGLKATSDLVIGLFLPCFMFVEIVRRFRLDIFPDWWIYPLVSVAITLMGYLLGSVVCRLDLRLMPHRKELVSVAAFQNSGYLPLPLVAVLLPKHLASQMFIMIFLFLLGFNMTIFSVGRLMVNKSLDRVRFDWKHMFNAPVVATLAALLVVFSGTYRFIPEFGLRAAESLGRCAIPLSILVVGGNLAFMSGKGGVSWRALIVAVGIKSLAMPVLMLGVVLWLKPQGLMGLLLLLQAAMPPAALLSVISRNLDQEDPLISAATFYGHLVSIVTIPTFLIFYCMAQGALY
jgi:hypothetical protein